jgi:hypothetical protein
MEPPQFSKVTVCGMGLLSENMLDVNKITKKKVKLEILTAVEGMSGFRKCRVEGLTLTFGNRSLSSPVKGRVINNVNFCMHKSMHICGSV